MSPLLHLVVATLRDPVEQDAFERAIERAHELRAAPGARGQFIGSSERQLIVATMIDSPANLDSFVASAEHMRFVMQGLAPLIAGMWSIAIEADLEPAIREPAHLWAFALPEREGIYEWQVRAFLDEAAQLGDGAIVGVTIEERERFRAGGLVMFGEQAEDIERRTRAVARRWAELSGGIEDALVDVYRP